MNWIKEHLELLVVVFGFGGLVSRDLEKEARLQKIEKLLIEDVPEMKEMIARIDERTKKL